jgi:hypothetical protein
LPQHDEFGTCKIRVFFGFAQKRLALPPESKKIQNPVPEPALNGDSGDKDGLSTDLSYPHSDFMFNGLTISLVNVTLSCSTKNTGRLNYDNSIMIAD